MSFPFLYDIKRRIDDNLMMGSVHSEWLSNYKIKGDIFMKFIPKRVFKE